MEAFNHECYYKFNYDFILKAPDVFGRLHSISWKLCSWLNPHGVWKSFLSLHRALVLFYLQRQLSSILTCNLAVWSEVILPQCLGRPGIETWIPC